MEKTTNVYFDGTCEHDRNVRVFRTFGNGRIRVLWVKGFEDGIVTVDPVGGCTITDFAKAIAGCFNNDSNFGSEVLRTYTVNENVIFKGIKFEFNGVTVTVTKENADADKIYQEWDAAMNAKAEKQRLEREAWLKTPEGQKYLAKQKAEAERREAIKAEVLRIDETVDMEFKDEEGKKAWEKMEEINSKDSYSNGVVKFARRWAKYMQKLIAEGKSVQEIAEKASQDCDIEGISGFMYGCAVNALAKSWKYGEELRRWHNKDYGYEGDGDGVVNPAVLTVKVG